MTARATPSHADYMPDSDLRFVEACGPELEAYLLSREVYWPLTQPKGEAALPRLTLGGMLLALRRLGVMERHLPPAEAARLARARARIETERLRWPAGVGAKMAAETRAHLNLWRAYLEDLAESPAAQADLYQGEVRQRVMLELLLRAPEGEAIPQEARRTIQALDALLRGRFAAGPFVWTEVLATAFPRIDFWFLYGGPQTC